MRQTKLSSPQRKFQIDEYVDLYTGRKEFAQSFFSLRNSQFNELNTEQRQSLFEMIDDIDVVIELDRQELIKSEEIREAKSLLLGDTIIHRYYQEIPINNITRSIRENFEQENSSLANSILRQLDIPTNDRSSERGHSNNGTKSNKRQDSNQPSSQVSRFVFLRFKNNEFEKLTSYERGRILNYMTTWNDWSFLPISKVTILDFTARFYEFISQGQFQSQSQAQSHSQESED